MHNVPDNILILYKEMGYGEVNIKSCWEHAKGVENLFQQYLIDGALPDSQNLTQQIPQRCNNISESFIFEKILEQTKHQTFQMNNFYRVKLRRKDQDVGLINEGNTCSINSVLQFFHLIPQLFELLIKCQNGQKDYYEKFVFEIQTLFTQLTASNLEYVSPKNAIKSITWGAEEQDYIGVQQDIVEIFNLILNKFDKSIRRLHQMNLMATDVFRVELFGNQQLNELFQIIILNDTNQKEYHPNLVSRLTHKNIRTFLLNEFTNKILVLPKFLRISINRIIYQNRYTQKVKDEFIIDDTLNLEICIYNNKNAIQKDQIAKLQNQTNELQKEIQKLRSDLQSLNGVIKIYEDEGIFIDLIITLKKKQEQLQNLLKQKEENYKQQQLNINKQTSNRFQYKIHSIVIHIGSAQEGHNFIYIYNFFLDKWMKYNDITVSFVQEHEVHQDSKTYGQFATYVNQDIIPQLKSHYEFLQKIGNIIVSQPTKELQYINELSDIPQNVLASVTQKNQENYRNQQNR